MISWPSPFIPAVPGTGLPLQVFDTAAGRLRPLTPGPVAEIYVCGITPYDATHIGHAATYVTFDLVGRVLRDAGHGVTYVQNVTDVDEPLFERAEREGIDWTHLARAQTDLVREDMTALQVIAPDHFVGAVESIPWAVEAIEKLVAGGTAYLVVQKNLGADSLQRWLADHLDPSELEVDRHASARGFRLLSVHRTGD